VAFLVPSLCGILGPKPMWHFWFQAYVAFLVPSLCGIFWFPAYVEL
jgi:hypothetical protein